MAFLYTIFCCPGLETDMKFTEPLRKYSDFRQVYENGRSKADRKLVMYLLLNGTDKNRLGISVSKKVGNSVVRHRIKRLVRESYRLHEACFRTGCDIVVIARRSAYGSSFQDIENSVICLGTDYGIYHKKESGPDNNEENINRND